MCEIKRVVVAFPFVPLTPMLRCLSELVTSCSAEGAMWGTRCPAVTVLPCRCVWTGRRECLPLALSFQQAGYNVLCFDFRAHGLSAGRFTSVGQHETRDVLGAVDYLRSRSAEVDPTRIAVIGFSMGAVATIKAAARCPDIAAVVADSASSDFVA